VPLSALGPGTENVNDQELNTRLSRISTQWTVVFQAHDPGAPGVSAAQQVLLQRYCGAVYRYLLGALRDPDAADVASQEFALRFVRGDFQRADPGRGRFRDFVKTALYHLIVDFQSRRQVPLTPTPLPPGERGRGEGPAQAVPDSGLSAEDLAALDRDFTTRWREEMLAKAWEALAAVQAQTGQPLHTAWRVRGERPDLKPDALAAELSTRLGRPISAGEVRQIVHHAREKFAELLVAEVARSVEGSDPGRLEQELGELGLSEYCRPALEKAR